ncbi:hypothetical protein G9A89_009434 [Geosiphon pyriformis]|nr:hypothetical protein G9A89_009434 [Geosiphon pyriformis]
MKKKINFTREEVFGSRKIHPGWCSFFFCILVLDLFILLPSSYAIGTTRKKTNKQDNSAGLNNNNKATKEDFKIGTFIHLTHSKNSNKNHHSNYHIDDSKNNQSLPQELTGPILKPASHGEKLKFEIVKDEEILKNRHSTSSTKKSSPKSSTSISKSEPTSTKTAIKPNTTIFETNSPSSSFSDPPTPKKIPKPTAKSTFDSNSNTKSDIENEKKVDDALPGRSLVLNSIGPFIAVGMIGFLAVFFPASALIVGMKLAKNSRNSKSNEYAEYNRDAMYLP